MPDMWNILVCLIGLVVTAVAVEALTEIVVHGVILDVIGLRPWATGRALPSMDEIGSVRWYHTALHKLLTCDYCASVWVAFPAAWVVPGGYFSLLPWDNVLIKWLVIHRLANWLHAAYELFSRGRVNTMDVRLEVTIRGGQGSTDEPHPDDKP